MSHHLTARLAWHNDGWNGHICQKPECNTYCVGRSSHPGDIIARNRNLRREQENAGKPIAQLDGADLPPCIYSVNAFGLQQIKGFSEPPDFWRNRARRVEWNIPQATVCAWPYGLMYDKNGYLENNLRRRNAEDFFNQIEKDKSLIFYHANYANPFSEDDKQCYVFIGVSKIKEVGERISYEGADDFARERYADGMVWARNVGSHYPNQGLRLPYHNYIDNFEAMQRFAVFPENPQVCKYGSKLITDDAAIGLLEQFLNSIHELQEMEDESENWHEKEQWILGCINELWKKRGLYPSLANVMKYLEVDETVIFSAHKFIGENNSKEAHRLFFNALDKGDDTPELNLTGHALQKIARQWRLRSKDAQELLRTIIPRLDLEEKQIGHIVNDKEDVRKEHGLPIDLKLFVHNPYVLCENYVGDSADDIISWNTVDRGVLPSQELGSTPLAGMERNDSRRFRALCIEQLRKESNQIFSSASLILEKIDEKMKRLPDWRSVEFTQRYFDVDYETLEDGLILRKEGDDLWLYLKHVHEDERTVEEALTKLAGRADISLTRPFSFENWCSEILDTESRLLAVAREEYTKYVKEQAKVGEKVFQKPFSVITGHAGTGKTSVICSIVRAVRQTEGENAPLDILAPTGKASVRIRDKLREQGIQKVRTSTVHSFLARHGWLYDNLTFKRAGGKRGGTGTIIVDEASMLDIHLMACLARALEWNQIKRFILIGDPNQLPPIGRGKIFSDVIDWLDKKKPENIGYLTGNMRQLENKVEKKGTAILRLANMFIGKDARSNGQSKLSEDKKFLSQIHKGDVVDEDMKIIYWDEPENLGEILLSAIEEDMQEHTGELLNQNKPYELWRAAFAWQAHKYQILTPHRGKLHGVEALNDKVQKYLSSTLIERYGTLGGITLCDKVIQIKNRPQSNMIGAYNFDTRKPEPLELFNGEIGFANKHNFDKGYYRLKRFQVSFENRKNLVVGYGNIGNGYSEKVEDNLELAYAISIHKAQGSEFENTYVIMPQSEDFSLSSELLYTALTRAQNHCTLFIQGDVSTILSAQRLENKQTSYVNSSLFHGLFQPVPDELVNRVGRDEEGKIHENLGKYMVRSKSELMIVEHLQKQNIPFYYEKLLKAPDGTVSLPNFTIYSQGKTFYWEHWLTDSSAYQDYRNEATEWYNKHFTGCLIETFEDAELEQQIKKHIDTYFS
ncbi:MAG: AAA family ATPase [Alphaproteobacteria bacterium GM202ARS2]|nr:AAA family ATPase [Alphaproteobacteria bacterium GM202ARS2]